MACPDPSEALGQPISLRLAERNCLMVMIWLKTDSEVAPWHAHSLSNQQQHGGHPPHPCYYHCLIQSYHIAELVASSWSASTWTGPLAEFSACKLLDIVLSVEMLQSPSS